jgi:hypothetical protein
MSIAIIFNNCFLKMKPAPLIPADSEWFRLYQRSDSNPFYK